MKDFVLSQLFFEKVKRIIWQLKKKAYLCKCYPENNLFTYTMVELLQKGKPLRVLLTEDWYLEKMMGTPLPIISTETYMYEVEGEEIGKAFTDFLHKNNCVFI